MPIIKCLYTPEEAAKILGLSTKSLRKHVREGRMRFINIGSGTKRKRMRFTPKNINTFIQNQKVKESPPCPSTELKAHHSTSTTSKSKVVAFTALQKSKASGKLKA